MNDNAKNEWLLLHAAKRGDLALAQHVIETTPHNNDSTALVNVNCIDAESSMTPLCFAARQGCKCLLEYLLSKGADINKTEGVYTPLTLAAINGSTELVKCLLSQGAQNRIRTKRGFTPLDAASLAGHLDIVKYLCKHLGPVLFLGVGDHQKRFIDVTNFDPDDTEAPGKRAFSAAVSWRQFEIMQYFVKKHSKLDLLNQRFRKLDDSTPLIFSCCERRDSEMVSFLLEMGADPNRLDSMESGYVALILACGRGDVALAKMLVQKGNANVNIVCQDPQHQTPLLCALAAGREHMVLFLLEHGADPNLASGPSPDATVSPLQLASGMGLLGAMQALVQHGGEITESDAHKPVLLACEQGHPHILQYLFEHFSFTRDVVCRKHDWLLVLFAAASEKETNIDMVRFLLHEMASDNNCKVFDNAVAEDENDNENDKNEGTTSNCNN